MSNLYAEIMFDELGEEPWDSEVEADEESEEESDLWEEEDDLG